MLERCGQVTILDFFLDSVAHLYAYTLIFIFNGLCVPTLITITLSALFTSDSYLCLLEVNVLCVLFDDWGFHFTSTLPVLCLPSWFELRKHFRRFVLKKKKSSESAVACWIFSCFYNILILEVCDCNHCSHWWVSCQLQTGGSACVMELFTLLKHIAHRQPSRLGIRLNRKRPC